MTGNKDLDFLYRALSVIHCSGEDLASGHPDLEVKSVPRTETTSEIHVRFVVSNDRLDHGLHGRRALSTGALARKLGLSPGAISQRRNKISEIVNNAEKTIYG